MDELSDEHWRDDVWKDLERYCEARKHVHSPRELAMLNELHGMLPFAHVVAEIERKFGSE